GASQPYVYNGIAWAIYENTDDHIALLKALTYSEISLKYSRDYNNMDTYAHVLFKLRRPNEALKAANEAIELAKQSKIEPNSTNDLLEEINQSMGSKSDN